ncbi:MAG: riboflavin biosynthesis protein RibF, partial [Bacteroidetes bacterium]|nr:riboflavin biosynthesis protein RibF [Bacteroidota bacterium]
AEKMGGESVLFTFYPHPRMVLFPESTDLKLLQTKEEKIDKLRRMGLQNIVMYPFSKEFSQLTATEFVRDILVGQMKVKKLVIGYDHQFGKNREGGLDFLREVAPTYGFEVIEIPAQEIEDVNVSSSKIRKALFNGEVEIAHSYLSEPYEITGNVVHGSALGRTIQFPTANLDLGTTLKLIPKKGVYAVQVKLSNGEQRMGMMNIGVKPTVQNESTVSLEVHLLDFDGNLYGETLTVQFLRYLRSEQKFTSKEDLQVQLTKDAEDTRSYFNTLV